MGLHLLSFDLGHVLATASYSIPPDSTCNEVTQELAYLGADLLLEVIKNLDWYKENKVKQSEVGVTYGNICLPCKLHGLNIGFF